MVKFDIETDNVEAETARLLALGADAAGGGDAGYPAMPLATRLPPRPG